MKIFLPLLLGTIVGLISNNLIDYDSLTKPFFFPPEYLFGIVWPILYLLMGISSYLIDEKNGNLNVFYLQLLLNLLWPFAFALSPILSFVIIIVLIIVVIKMLLQFKDIDSVAFYLQIPYLIWLIFAAILNLSIVILN